METPFDFGYIFDSMFYGSLIFGALIVTLLGDVLSGLQRWNSPRSGFFQAYRYFAILGLG